MRRTLFGLATLAALTTGLLLSGCGNGGQIEYQGMTFGPDKAGEENSYGITVLRLHQRPFLVMVNQGHTGLARSTPGGIEGSLLIDDVRLTMDQRSIEYACSTKDGVDGQVRIAGQSFDLRKGNVFLVSANTRPAAVEQIAVDLSNLPGSIVSDKEFRLLGAIDPRVTASIEAWRKE